MIKKIKCIYGMIQNQIPNCQSFMKETAVLLDFVFSKLRYHISLEEYRQYAFYKLKDNAKKEYITEHDVIDVIPILFNNGNQRKILDDKVAFDYFYEDLLGREFCFFSEGQFEIFYRFTEGRQQIVVKPTDSWCGRGVQKYMIPEQVEEKRELYEKIVKDYSTFLAEEYFMQHEQIAELNPDTVNTIRVISIADSKGEIHIPFASIRIGRKGAVVDNFCAGGMAASIDTESGVIVSGAYDRAEAQFLIHPDTGTTIIGRCIPYWGDVLNTVQLAAKRLPAMRLVGWDVVIRNDGRICLLEGNSNPGARTIQMPLKRGIKPDYQRYLGEF